MAKSLSSPPPVLIDNHQRRVDYARISLMDACNLRCQYCMPLDHHFINSAHYLSDSEILNLVRILAEMGIRKWRLTGGEPFLRPGIYPLIAKIRKQNGVDQLQITSNGTRLVGKIKQLKDMGVDGINLSLDTLNPEQFYQITRRDTFKDVQAALE